MNSSRLYGHGWSKGLGRDSRERENEAAPVLFVLGRSLGTRSPGTCSPYR